jgi:CRP-like cAMP-binding protein
MVRAGVFDHGPYLTPKRGNPRRGVPLADVGALVAIEERKKLLSEVWLFNGATDEELTMLAELAYEVTVGPHVDIVNENEFGDELFLVVDGHAAVTRDGVDLGVLNAGDFFGEMALLAPGPRMATVKAESDVEAIKIGAERFQAFLVEHPAISLSMMKQLVVRLREVEQRIDAWMA